MLRFNLASTGISESIPNNMSLTPSLYRPVTYTSRKRLFLVFLQQLHMQITFTIITLQKEVRISSELEEWN